MHVLISTHLKTELGGTMWGSLEFSVEQFPLWSSALWTCATLAVLASCVCLLNWDCSPCLGSFFLSHGLEMPFHKLEQAYGLFYVSRGSLSFVAWYLVSILQTFVSLILSLFVCFRQDCKSKSLLTASWPEVVIRVWALLASFWKRLLSCSGNPKLISLITVNCSGKRTSFSIYVVLLRDASNWSWLSHVFTSGLIPWPRKWCISIGQSPGSYTSPHPFLRWSTGPSPVSAMWNRDMVAPKRRGCQAGEQQGISIYVIENEVMSKKSKT